ncbi:MAG: biotin/lipoyl-binding protein [Ruminococcaceae bacterium]|nr:biotin/lipoyl-binding protein [Oscillospiraceae bacterium]
MKKYKVNVNGTSYEIEIELMSESEASSAKASAPAQAPAQSAPVVAGEGEQVSAPMPGTILDVKVNVGDTVKKGQVLFILEAMKMENEIMAGVDGQITSVGATKGASVQTGDMLCTIK